MENRWSLGTKMLLDEIPRENNATDAFDATLSTPLHHSTPLAHNLKCNTKLQTNKCNETFINTANTPQNFNSSSSCTRVLWQINFFPSQASGFVCRKNQLKATLNW
ncbi:hypothetical protein HELRODRAFT_162747 [Helobdella robusta]|uniref:Uncharacterized protein n=1 Tax=Helobdella robusta TaxID=6412 RepID=T1ET29_HELRO|nr:hypothetical protein HELRODRAFT_162747 [Helobdella robusta]ESN99232.1 hypothetical protein HELRODRAFT_162747 [Helobdella robusta]